jgi:hypothetical protein
MKPALILKTLGAGFGILFLVHASDARHHAFSAEFDIEKPLTLEGTLTEWEMINPHSWFHIAVENEDGEVESWMIEGGSPNQLIRMGVTQNTVATGTRLVIEGYLAKDGTNKAVGRNFILEDGSRLFLGGSAPGAEGDGQ